MGMNSCFWQFVPVCLTAVLQFSAPAPLAGTHLGDSTQWRQGSRIAALGWAPAADGMTNYGKVVCLSAELARITDAWFVPISNLVIKPLLMHPKHFTWALHIQIYATLQPQ